MVWRQLLLTGVLLAVIFAPIEGVHAAELNSCTPIQLATDTCGASVTPSVGKDGVNLGGTVTRPRAPGTPGSPTRPGRGEAGGNGPAAPPTCVLILCRDGFTVTLPTDGRGPISLADLVNFRPVAGVHHMEPSGWMVVGLDTNFYVDSGSHVQNNLLLGLPASVRFTPVSYHWTYGDGSSATHSTKGSSWKAQGLPEFSPTATSHLYRAPGTYPIDVTVDFRAEYTFGGAGWTAIDGTVPVASARLTAIAGDADTVLVARECTIDPKGPGC